MNSKSENEKSLSTYILKLVLLYLIVSFLNIVSVRGQDIVNCFNSKKLRTS